MSGFGDKGQLPLPPARRIAILTCMDARIDPAKLALVISYKLLGTREWFVIHHTNCGMELFTDEIIRGLLASSLETATHDGKSWKDVGNGPGSRQGDFIDWLTIRNQAESVVTYVERIRNHPLVPRSIPIFGYIYQVETGKLVEVPQATTIGRAA